MQNRFRKNVNDFLRPYEISNEACPVFEEYVLNESEVNKEVVGSGFGEENNNSFKLLLKGIDADDAKKVKDYLEFICEETVGMGESDFGYEFQTSLERANNELFPEFETYFKELIQKEPEKIAKYKADSKEEFEEEKRVQGIKDALTQVTDSAVQLAASESVSEFVKGKLDLLKNLIVEAMLCVEMHREHECGEGVSNFRQMATHYGEIVLKEGLEASEAAQNLINGMKNYDNLLPKRNPAANMQGLLPLLNLFSNGGSVRVVNLENSNDSSAEMDITPTSSPRSR